MFTTNQQSLLRPTLESIGTAVGLFESDEQQCCRLISANNLFCEAFGIEADKAFGGQLKTIFPRYLSKSLARLLEACLTEQKPEEGEIPIDREERCRWWRVVLSPVLGNKQVASRVLLTAIDITDKKELEQANEIHRMRFKAVVEAAYDGIIVVNEAQQVTLINDAASEIFGYSQDELNGQPLERLIPKRFHSKHSNYVQSFKRSPVMSRPMHDRALVTGMRKDETEFPAEITIAKISVASGTEFTAAIRDVSERARLIEELQKAAIEDPLTGVYNRRHFIKVLTREHKRSLRFGRTFSLLMIDIDHFKQINDSFGHAAGDQVLQELVGVIREQVRDVDVLARWGGEEFLLILPETGIQGGQETAERILNATRKLSIGLPDRKISITVSIGVTDSTEPCDDTTRLIEMADKAMYQVKQTGRDNMHIYSGDNTAAPND